MENNDTPKPFIAILNGANLNLLGKRQPHIYGHQSFEDYLELLRQEFFQTVDIQYFQSNIEGELINQLHYWAGYINPAQSRPIGIIINAGAYTHTSIALADALAAIQIPTIEVHISNIHAREPFRHHSHIAPQAQGSIIGLGLHGYKLAILHFLATIF